MFQQWRISLTTEPIWFSFTVKILIGQGKVFNYFDERYIHPLNRNITRKKNTIDLKMGRDKSTSTPPPLPIVTLEASRGVSASKKQSRTMSVWSLRSRFSIGFYSSGNIPTGHVVKLILFYVNRVVIPWF